MFDNLITFSLRSRGFVLLLLVGAGGFGGVLTPQPADRRRARHHQRAGHRPDRRPGARAGGGRAVHHHPRRKCDERHPSNQGGPIDHPVRLLLGDDRLRGRDRHLLGPTAGQRTADAGSRGHSRGVRLARHGADRHRAGRDLPVRGQERAGREAEAFLDGAAHDPRLGRGATAAERARGDRGQHVRRRAEDVRGPARPRAAAGPRDLGHPGLRGAAAEQQQRRRRLHRAQRAGPGHPRQGPRRFAEGHRRGRARRRRPAGRRSTSATSARSGSRR